MSNNTIILLGRLGKDPEIKVIGENKLASFNLAVTRSKDKTDWFNCQVWQKQADTAEKYLKKGSQILISGSMIIETWEKDGKTNYKNIVNGKSFQMVGAKGDNKSENLKQDVSFDDFSDDIPPF